MFGGIRRSMEERTLHDEVRAKDTHGSDTDTRLGGTVRGTQAGENNGTGATHGTEEGLLVIVSRADRECA